MTTSSEERNGELVTTTRPDPLAILQRAIDRGVDADKLGKLMDLAERWHAMQAEQAFNASLSACQREIHAHPVVKAENNPQTRSKYADLAAINAAIVPIYTGHGFSLDFTEGEPPEHKKTDHIRVIGCLRHEGGFSREYFLDVPLDGKGIKGNANMTPTHAFGSTLSYGRRYMTCPIFNVALRGEDNDGNTGASPPITITPDQLYVVNTLLDECDKAAVPINREKFTAWLREATGAAKTSEIPQRHFLKVYQFLAAARNRKPAEKGVAK